MKRSCRKKTIYLCRFYNAFIELDVSVCAPAVSSKETEEEVSDRRVSCSDASKSGSHSTLSTKTQSQLREVMARYQSAD